VTFATFVPALGLVLASATPIRPDIAFLAPAGATWQVWVAVGGTDPRPITNDSEDKISLSSARNGELLVLTRSGRGLVLRASGQVVENLNLGPGAHEADLSPDGSQVAFSREEAAGSRRARRICLANREGSDARPLTGRDGLQHSPAWSPDGVALVFTRGGDAGGEDLWWVRLDGSDERQLTVGSFRYLEPTVAPDGSIYVSSDRGGDYDIWRVDPASGSVDPIISRPGYEGVPRVSPAGDRILFVSGFFGKRAVWIADVDGSRLRQLTNGFSDVKDPVWLPVAGASRGGSPHADHE
jgi:Tol biopolymer transport system component